MSNSCRIHHDATMPDVIAGDFNNIDNTSLFVSKMIRDNYWEFDVVLHFRPGQAHGLVHVRGLHMPYQEQHNVILKAQFDDLLRVALSRLPCSCRDI